MRAAPTITLGSGSATGGTDFTTTEMFGIRRGGGNAPNMGTNAKADAEL